MGYFVFLLWCAHNRNQQDGRRRQAHVGGRLRCRAGFFITRRLPFAASASYCCAYRHTGCACTARETADDFSRHPNYPNRRLPCRLASFQPQPRLSTTIHNISCAPCLPEMSCCCRAAWPVPPPSLLRNPLEGMTVSVGVTPGMPRRNKGT